MKVTQRPEDVERLLYSTDSFSREDETDDQDFYSRDRFVSHLDTRALSTVERLIGSLVVEKKPVLLDLMASWHSHIPDHVNPKEVVGLGLNQKELSRNKMLTETVIHDLNKDPNLPFESNRFDVVLNTVSVDYMTRPFHVFRDVGRILKPGGLFLVIFSNRFFPQKVVKIWRHSSEAERLMLIEDLFRAAEIFESPQIYISKGKPRPKDDKYAGQGIPSDPIYAVYADKIGEHVRQRQPPDVEQIRAIQNISQDFERRKAMTKETLCCPHCGERMNKWRVPDSPFSTWDTEYMYICFNDECPYLVRGWDVMNRQGNVGVSYRQMYNPKSDSLLPVPVPSLKALRDSIVDEA